MRLRFSPRAVADLIEIADYLEAQRIDAGAKMRAAILSALQTVGEFPQIGREQEAEGVRKLAIRKYPYLIYYTVHADEDEIVVVTIRHAARRRQYVDR